jgi:ubiquitin C-terminal hydrolase
MASLALAAAAASSRAAAAAASYSAAPLSSRAPRAAEDPLNVSDIDDADMPGQLDTTAESARTAERAYD